MKIVTSSFRLSVLAVVGFAVTTVVFNSAEIQYAQLHGAVRSFGIAEYFLNAQNMRTTFERPQWVDILLSVLKVIELSIYALLLILGAVVAQSIPLRNEQISVETGNVGVTVAHHDDSQVSYDNNVLPAVLPLLIISIVLGYLTQFVTWLFIWFVVSLATWFGLELLTSTSVATTQANSSSKGGKDSNSSTVRNTGSIAQETISNASSTVTSVFVRESDPECSKCGTNLEKYDSPEFCPECDTSQN